MENRVSLAGMGALCNGAGVGYPPAHAAVNRRMVSAMP